MRRQSVQGPLAEAEKPYRGGHPVCKADWGYAEDGCRGRNWVPAGNSRPKASCRRGSNSSGSVSGRVSAASPCWTVYSTKRSMYRVVVVCRWTMGNWVNGEFGWVDTK